MSDITLDGDWVIVDGHWLRIRSWDLMLDAPDRRKAEAGWRRALVHDVGDGLTINYASDYPNGVTINGEVRLPVRLTVNGLDVASMLRSHQDHLAKVEARSAALEGHAAALETRVKTLEAQVAALLAATSTP